MRTMEELSNRLNCSIKKFILAMNLKNETLTEISKIIEITSELPLSNLEFWERQIRWEYESNLLSNAQPKWKIWSKPTTFLTWMDLCSADGYKRERTLHALTGAAPNSFFFAIAVRRLNDWVPQVRAAARDKLALIAQASNPFHVVNALCFILSNWNSWQRMEAADKQVLLDIISSKNIAEAFKSRIVSATSGPMTLIFSQVGRTSALDNYLDEIALKAIQPSVRAKAYRAQLEHKMVWCEGFEWQWTDIRYCEGRLMPILAERKLTATHPVLETLNRASIDRSPIVRRVAAEMLIRDLENLGAESFRLAALFATDESGSVAERGEFALRKLGVDA